MIERATVAVLCPVGSSRRGGFRGEDSAGSGTVLGDELLFQPASQLVRQNAHPDVCDATGPIGNDELHPIDRRPRTVYSFCIILMCCRRTAVAGSRNLSAR
jgi:hypothetical protein